MLRAGLTIVHVMAGISTQAGVKTLRTQDISAPSDWCRSVRAVRHQCQSVCTAMVPNCLDL